jgi:molybdopterin synthase sulfur carrier subunit
MAKVRIPTPLRKLTKGLAEVEGAGSTVRDLFLDLESRYPGLREKVFDEGGEIRRFINIFVNGEDVRSLSGAQSEVRASDEVSVVPAIAGGD